MQQPISTDHTFEFCGETLVACASGVLFWPEQRILCVSDLHFGKSSRYAVQGGAALPPYETLDTLARLDLEITRYDPETIICLGDSFDALRTSQELDSEARNWITQLQAGRHWIWIEGNHDPGPVGLGGTHLGRFERKSLTFHHITASDTKTIQNPEISGHFHPKARIVATGRSVTRPCFVTDGFRLIMPAFGTYTGGLDVTTGPFETMLSDSALCILTGKTAQPVPLKGLRRR